ncbi:MAG: hypothetical protein Q9O62_03515 [Ardenticatenia bacterium]|nr:hypothetical protein [Ardenticatenia bacterium]
MNAKRFAVHLLVVVVLVTVVAGLAQAQGPQAGEGGATPQGTTAVQAVVGTTFTYQGRLTDGGNPANGTYDFEFKLYDGSDPDTATQVGSTVTKEDVPVTDGLFTVELDLGDVFDGTALWLQIGVRPGTSTDAFTSLAPLQPLNPAPYAMSLMPRATIRDPSTTGTTPALSVQSDSPVTQPWHSSEKSPLPPLVGTLRPCEALIGEQAASV